MAPRQRQMIDPWDASTWPIPDQAYTHNPAAGPYTEWGLAWLEGWSACLGALSTYFDNHHRNQHKPPTLFDNT